jgi:hypothetical protein
MKNYIKTLFADLAHMAELGNLLWDKTTTISSKDTELQKLKDYLIISLLMHKLSSSWKCTRQGDENV